MRCTRLITGCGWLWVPVALLLVLPPVAQAQDDRPLGDRDISDAVEEEFLTDLSVDSNEIDVMTTDGVVTLSGTVDSILAKERAVRIAQTVKGVKSVVDRIQVEPSGRTDAEIREDVENELMFDPATDSYEIVVAVTDGVVTLSGEVDSWTEKNLAGKVAKSVRGVRKARNNITFDYSTERPDHEIEAEIRQRLRWDRFVDDAMITVEVDNGRVTLSGTVGSAVEKQRARTLAWVSGVEDVNASPLKVRFWARDEELRKDKYVERSDSELKRAVKDALVYDPRVASFNIDVSADGSVVTLRGKVDNVKAKRAAANTAKSTVGVWRVKNYVKVRGKDFPTEAQIEKRIRDSLLRNPYVDRYEITVDAEDGTAKLYGTVDSYFEKREAEDIASRTTGVVDVRNNIVVDYDTPTLTYDPYLYEWDPYDYDWYTLDEDVVTAPDHEIEDDIEDELWWSPFVDADEVTVEVENGVATLTGTVDTWAEWRSARENAFEGGAVAIVDEIRIDYGPDDEGPTS